MDDRSFDVMTEATVNGHDNPSDVLDNPISEIKPPASYAEATLETIKAALESGARAITHYEGRRSELDADYKARRAEIDAHLKVLRSAVGWSEPKAKPKPPVAKKKTEATAPKPQPVVKRYAGRPITHPSGLTIAQRVANLLTTNSGGPLPISLIANRIGESNAAVNSAVRSRPALLAFGKNQAGQLTAQFLPAVP
jgi:hypothetical protein